VSVALTMAAAFICAASPAEPEPFDLVIEAETFDRGSVMAVAGTRWADAGGIIQCADQSPDWAEWDFTIETAGVYLLSCKFAAQVSRPVAIYIDGACISTGALKGVTGSWMSSSARWFDEGFTPLKPGNHTLRIRRALCIPHIDAFGLRRMPEFDLTKGAFGLPEDLWMKDNYPIQDWMIWTIGGTEQFEVRDGAYHIVNGQHTLNRPLYGTNGPEHVFAGDRPVIVLTRGPATKLGALGAQIVTGESRTWLDEAERVAFAYDGAGVRWDIKDPALGEGTLTLEVLPLPDAAGFIARATSDTPVKLSWWYGGLRDSYPENKAGHGALPGGRDPSDCTDNTVEISGETTRLVNALVAGAEAFVGCTGAAQLADEASALRADVTVGPDAVYVIAATNVDAVGAALSAPGKAWDEAQRHYEAIASRLATTTPSPILDASMRGNNMAMDGQWRPPSYLHGALRWGTECGGWFLGWRGWYGPIVAGDFERVSAAARMHFHHQYTEPAEGLHSAGKIAPFVHFEGKEKRAPYNMHEVFLDHLRSYYWWTGDRELMAELWPNIKAALAYQRREIGRDLDGLYTNAINTWISDGHHYNGNACTQASAYAVMHNRWAADVAELAGDDAAFYAAEAERTLEEMNRRLWMADKGYYAEYVDGDGVYHDASEAATIYHAAEMGAADAFQAYQMTRYADERLWRFGDQILANDWYPVIVTCGLIGFNESLNTALAYYYAGRYDRAWRLLKVCCDSTAKATVPGSISCYGSREGEQGVYIDFTDASSMFARTVVEGLFGLQPRVDQGRVEWSPRFPTDWDNAELSTRGFSVEYTRANATANYVMEGEKTLDHVLALPVDFGSLEAFTVNGEPAEPEVVESVLRPYLRVRVPEAQRTVVAVKGTGTLPGLDYPEMAAVGDAVVVRATAGTVLEVRDPQGIFAEQTLAQDGVLQVRIAENLGHHTAFAKLQSGAGTFWAPIDIEVRPAIELLDERLVAVSGVAGIGLAFTVRNNRNRPCQTEGAIGLGGTEIAREDLSLEPGASQDLRLTLEHPHALTPGHTTVSLTTESERVTGRTRLWRVLDALSDRREAFAAECTMLEYRRNDTLAEIFTREYDVANPPELNNWTWYKTDCINSDAMRTRAQDGVLMTHVGVPFAVTTEGNDGLFVSRWDPFPQSARVEAGVRGDKLYLLLANHTHNSQTHLTQAEVTLEYDDGEKVRVPLNGPHDMDGMLQHYSDMAPEWLGGIEGGWYGHGRASGVHADVVDIELDGSRTLAAFEIRCVTEETLVGLLGATVHRMEEN
jgi:Domain of unknown function (DUF4450)